VQFRDHRIDPRLRNLRREAGLKPPEAALQQICAADGCGENGEASQSAGPQTPTSISVPRPGWAKRRGRDTEEEFLASEIKNGDLFSYAA
jgi:hypothetical protein